MTHQDPWKNTGCINRVVKGSPNCRYRVDTDDVVKALKNGNYTADTPPKKQLQFLHFKS